MKHLFWLAIATFCGAVIFFLTSCAAGDKQNTLPAVTSALEITSPTLLYFYTEN